MHAQNDYRPDVKTSARVPMPIVGSGAKPDAVHANRRADLRPPSSRPSESLVRLVRLLAREAAAAEHHRGYGFSRWELGLILAALAGLVWLASRIMVFP